MNTSPLDLRLGASHHACLVGDPALHLALVAALAPRRAPPGAAVTWRRWAALVALAALPWVFGCKGEAQPTEQELLTWHAALKPGTPMEPVIKACGGPVCKLRSAVFVEIEYVSDASANVKGILLRTARPDPPNVQKSQEIFEATRQELSKHLGAGESFLQSNDPTYWPTRDKLDRVATLTSTDDGATVLAVGAVGPDSDKIPDNGAAHDPERVHAFWQKITALPALGPAPE